MNILIDRTIEKCCLPCFARLWQTIEMNDKLIEYSTIGFLSPFLYNNGLEQ
jgi:hypothetical protein